MSDNFILCHCTAVKKQLQAETLTQALNHLILYHEMLQVRLENGMYVSEPETDKRHRNDLLSLYDFAGKSPTEVKALVGQIIIKLANEIRCERGASIRAALLRIDKDFNKLLLLSHRAIVDQRGLVLILEDLYRLYEQLSTGKKVALRPVRKTYAEFIKEVAATKKIEDGVLFDSAPARDPSDSVVSDGNCRKESDRQKTAALSIMLDKNLKRRLFSWRFAEFELAPVEALAGGVLRSLAKASKGDSVSIWIKSDYRFADETLKSTAGALTQTYALPHEFVEEREFFSSIKKLRRVLRDIPLRDSPRSISQSSKNSFANRQLRLNLEYLTDEPWLGGDEWLPEGFIITEKDRLSRNYSIEIIPILSMEGIEILVKYGETLEAREFVDKFAANLVPELEMILRYCEGYVDAKEFWMREFAKPSAQMRIEIESDGRKIADKGRASSRCEVEKSVIDRALVKFEANESQLLLAAYSVLVSRLGGREDLVLLCVIDRDDERTVFPLWLNPSWASSFKLYVEQVKSKLRQANILGRYAMDILSEEQPKHGRPFPFMNAGYIYRQNSLKRSVEPSANGLLTSYPMLNQDSDLTLEISECEGDLDICFIYEKSCFGAEIIKRLGVYLNAILESATANEDIKLGNVQFEGGQKVSNMASVIAEDAFKF